MSAHTPGPWYPVTAKTRARSASVRAGPNEGGFTPCVCYIQTADVDVGNANANRIASCVNALAGLSQDALDGGWNFVDHGTAARKTEIECWKAKELNSELADALKKLINRTADIEVLGEWLAMGMNHQHAALVRASVNRDIAAARSALAKHIKDAA